MIDINEVTAALKNNLTKTISQSSLKKIILTNLLNRSFCLDTWRIKNIFEKIETSNFSEEQMKELATFFVQKANESFNDLQTSFGELFNEKQASTETSQATQDDLKDDKKTPAEHVEETPTTKVEFSED